MRNEAEINLHLLWAATSSALKRHLQRVQEGPDERTVLEALDFSRYCTSSGLVSLLEVFTTAKDELLRVDGPALRDQATELTRECQERLSRNRNEMRLPASDARSIHEKLDAIAGYLAKLSLESERFNVISGGLAGEPAVGRKRH